MINVGIIGVGFMGMVHYLAYQKLPGVRVVALCDRSTKKLAGDWTDIHGNFGPPGELMDLTGIATYDTVEEFIAHPDLDLVDITLPPSLHADAAIAALSAGRHVFCEKPMAMTVEDCDRITAAQQASDRHLLIGHVLPFFPEYDWALREIRSGNHGKLLGGSFKRVISNPAWLANYWDAAAVGGPMLDLHIHDAHFIRLLFGMPSEVVSHGACQNDLPKYWHSVFQFANLGATAQATSGVIDQPGRPFLHGFEIRLERSTLTFEFAVLGDEAKYLCPPTLISDKGVHPVQLTDGDPMLAFEAEIGHVLNVIAHNAEPGVLAADLARDAISLCNQQTQSLLNS